ncbi:glycosyltransferase family 2 protein [Azotobacter beijerinckii]|uniref:glycosyltransferase family 2 protein n=1 Tax=Azotobacter beijerinckii TaxID=170623 RepID=UPI002953809C|nr:cellulose synthase catalytic subunit [Azotobacter beijerinckii]MDV7212373.1 cellulose synthase catalytic subunit [Azotobacter beijerinckii]
MKTPEFYFSKYENRYPPEPLKSSIFLEFFWQVLACLSLVLGGRYLYWRWMHSLNYDALWLALPLVIAETLAYAGLILFIINLWKTKDVPAGLPPKKISDCTSESPLEDRIISVDIFFATYNEDPELVRLGIRDAKKITYPSSIDMKIFVLDDGHREEMKQVAQEEQVLYISRENNIGFKAGNLRNAMDHTSGDFIVIFDADTRPFPTLLTNTLGYFRDPAVAWVQTPQWFYDIPEGVALSAFLGKSFGVVGKVLGRAVEQTLGPIQLGYDPFVNDPQMFYDIIQRRRNWANAAFCCGAGSIHRREAVMEAALKSYSTTVTADFERTLKKLKESTKDKDIPPVLLAAMHGESVHANELTPYKFHVSEDIYTSLIIHSDRERGWKSVLHPGVESKMLSPQDLLSWTIQRFKYAGGTLDIFFHDNPLLRKGLTLPQKLMYGATFYSYFGCLWNLLFLVAPIIYFFSGVSPLAAYDLDFYLHILPFLIALELAMLLGTWGIASYQARASYLSFFYVNIKALYTVLSGKKISFHVTPKDRQSGFHLWLVWPHIALIVLTLLGIAYASFSYLYLEGGHTLLGVISNSFWGLNNVFALSLILRAAIWSSD